MRWIAAVVALLLAGAAAALWLVDTSFGHRFIADQIAAQRPASGLRFSVGRITGSVWSKATLIDVRVSDPQGPLLAVPRAELDWRPIAWLGNRLDINALAIPEATLIKPPTLNPGQKRGPILPGFDIRVGGLRIDRLVVGPRVTGVRRIGSVVATGDVRNRRAMVKLMARIEGSDDIRLTLDAAPDADRFDLDLQARAAADGLLAKLSGIARPLSLRIAGEGRWARWRGTAKGQLAGADALDLALGNDAGRYTLAGTLGLDRVVGGKAARLFAPRVTVRGAATLADRILAGNIALRSRALVVDSSGAIDLATSSYRNLRTRLRVLDPGSVIDRASGRNIELRAVLDGVFDSAGFDYRLTADRVQFGGREGFEGVRASGGGRLSPFPIAVPVRLEVARVTGVDAMVGGILRNLSAQGILRATPARITGDNIPFRSDKLAGTLSLVVDLKAGRFDVGLSGGLRKFLIPGLGVVDVASKLRVVPAPGGKGALITGNAAAQFVRLDNDFLASLAHGLPRITTSLRQSTDGVLHLDNLLLTAPDIRITGNGYLRRDGSVHFEGSGTQRQYGPLTLKLDGRLERPTVDLKFAHPNEALGLRDVTAHLDPTAEGFAFTASGGSALGAFDGRGAILLPKGGTATIAIAALDVADMHASGSLRAVTGGFDGRLDVSGAARGTLAFAPVGKIQRVEAHLEAANAQVTDTVRLRRGKLDLVALLDPDGVSIEAKADGAGLRQGSLVLGRFNVAASLRGGTGTINGQLSGTRGRAFDIRLAVDATPDRYSVAASGTIDRRPITLVTPAVVRRIGDGWQFAPTRVEFAGGESELSGRYAGDRLALDATLARMPLSVLDIGYPGLGLSGIASGRLAYAQGDAGPPTGRIDMTVKGLSRSGLVLTSQPVDMGLAGVLGADSLALRAIMASGGKTIGRAQARLSPLGQGDLVKRLTNAGLFAQVRYDGPADTLWRLTGIELFDLSGPVAIGADLTGRVNDPRITGALRAKGARIESARTGTVLTNVQGAGNFSGSVLRIDNFTADAGRGGRIAGSGSFDFAAVHGFGIDLKLQAERAVMINRDDIGATITGPITIHSDGDGGLISGDVVLNASRYRLGQATAAAAVPKLNIREINLPGSEDETDSVPVKPWRLDVRARAPDSLDVSGLGLTSRWSATMQLGGIVEEPTIAGRADIIRGTYEFSGREFAISRGTIRFLGNSPPDPAIDIAASADTTGLSATIRVTGQATKPDISFSSTPALPQDELLSRLLFGTSITQLSAPEALQLASAVAALQGGGNGLNPINALRRVAGLDRLRILPADKTVGRTTSFAAGKYITRRLYAEIITDGQGYSATQVEFQITRWLSILSTISTLGRQSANVRVSKDY